ncbi:MAG: PAS domain-containing protein, partial [Deltaproteobacteria bacterium]|nr:PAS domain-containing protein [Deltaproteobacteria bacterium]
MVDFLSRYHFRSFLEAFADPVWIVNRSFRLIYMNPAAQEKFSLKLDQVVGKLCHQALFENPSACPFCTLKQMFSSGKSSHINFTLLDTDGRNHVYSLSNYPLVGINGEVEYGLAVCLDKSEGADLFAEISRLQGLAAMGEFSAELSHEIRNPLNSIEIQMSLLQRMAKRFASAEADAFLQVVEVVRAESRRLNSLAGDFLQIQKSRCLTLAACDPFIELKRVVDVLREEALSENIAICLDLEKKAIKIRADCEKLQQAFMNLMKNAFEAMVEDKTPNSQLEMSGRIVENR